jgi:hypothetical protein
MSKDVSKHMSEIVDGVFPADVQEAAAKFPELQAQHRKWDREFN